MKGVVIRGVEMKVAEMAQRREANRRYRDNKRKRRQEMEKNKLVTVTRRGDRIEAIMLLEPGGGLWKKFETRRMVLMEITMIVGEIVEEVNGIREDGEEWVELIGASKIGGTKNGSDVSMTLELRPFARELSKPKIEALIEIGIKKFLRRPEIDPKDYLRGPGWVSVGERERIKLRN